MYYPLLRGRQNELLAIKELLDNGILKGEVRMLRDERRSLKAKISQLEKNIKTIKGSSY